MAWTQSDLDAIDDAIKAKVTGGAIASYTIGSRNVAHMRLDELWRLRKDVAALVVDAAATTDFVLARTRPR